MKIRILNGGHAAIAYPAGLLGIHFVHEAMADPLVRGFLDKLETEEIIPCVPPVPGVDLDDYYRLVAGASPIRTSATRFRGCARTARTGSRNSSCPRPATGCRAGADVTGLALESALWCRYCAGDDR